MRSTAVLCLICVSAMPVPALAFLGFGDVSFDPAAHAELVKLYEEALQLYRLTQKEVERAGEIRRFIRAAESDRSVIRTHRVGPLLRDALRVTGHAAATRGRQEAYRQLAGAMRRVAQIRALSVQDLSLLDRIIPGTQHSASLIARSTALLATFAAGREERALRRRMAINRAVQRGHAAATRLQSVYRAIGAGSW